MKSGLRRAPYNSNSWYYKGICLQQQGPPLASYPECSAGSRTKSMLELIFCCSDQCSSAKGRLLLLYTHASVLQCNCWLPASFRTGLHLISHLKKKKKYFTWCLTICVRSTNTFLSNRPIGSAAQTATLMLPQWHRSVCAL